MRKIALMALPLFALSMNACSDDSGKNDSSVNHDMAAGGGDMAQTGGDMSMNNFPTPPTLGTQIDRMGRPGVNTALTDPFWDTAAASSAANAMAHEAKQDAYNAASDPTTWATLKLSSATGAPTLMAIFQGTLAVYDALNGTGPAMANDGCGDQLAITSPVSSTPYVTLATVLANDRIFINSASGDCTTYLAVEANAIGVTNTDCGGRVPSYDVIDITYSALAGGAAVPATCLSGTGCGVTDGIAADGSTSATFPFLGTPL